MLSRVKCLLTWFYFGGKSRNENWLQNKLQKKILAPTPFMVCHVDFWREESDAVLIVTGSCDSWVMVSVAGIHASCVSLLDWFGSTWPSQARVCWAICLDHRWHSSLCGLYSLPWLAAPSVVLLWCSDALRSSGFCPFLVLARWFVGSFSFRQCQLLPWLCIYLFFIHLCLD